MRKFFRSVELIFLIFHWSLYCYYNWTVDEWPSYYYEFYKFFTYLPRVWSTSGFFRRSKWNLLASFSMLTLLFVLTFGVATGLKMQSANEEKCIFLTLCLPFKTFSDVKSKISWISFFLFLEILVIISNTTLKYHRFCLF